MENRCGVCNYNIPLEYASNNRMEEDKTATSYHFACGTVNEPCVDCGQHRKFCDECRES